MDYIQLEELAQQWKGKVCLFGAGIVGKSWGYDILDIAGFKIDFYCDNHIAAGKEIRNGIYTISFEELQQYINNVIIFIANANHADEIHEQLEKNAFPYIYDMDYFFLPEFLDSIVKSDDTIKIAQYKKFIDDREYLKYKFMSMLGYPLDIEHPKTFNEKLQWLKIYEKNPEYTKMVDKYLFKEYVEEKVGKEYIIPLLGVWDTFEEIDFDELPESFVLKCTNDAGSTAIIKNKKDINKEKLNEKFSKALKRDYSYLSREYPYKNVKNRIIAEKYIESEKGDEFIDYKMMCFGGKVKLSFTCSGRNSEDGLCVTFYDLNWERLPFERHYPASKIDIPKPVHYDEMVNIAEKLADGIPFVRVDFYEIDGKVYVGEMTFFPGGGFEEFEPQEWDKKLGDFINLPLLKNEDI